LNNAGLFFSSGSIIKTYTEVLKEVQLQISTKYATIMSRYPDKQKEQIKSYITKYLADNRLCVEGLTLDELIEKLYLEMAEFSFLTRYIFSSGIEEININSWRDIKIIRDNGTTEKISECFNSPEHAVDVIRRLLHRSGMILDNSQPIVRGHLANNIRITVFGNPVTDREKGVAASIRIVNPQKLSRENFIKNKTATPEILDFLSLALRYGVSMCMTGATSSGKTTLMSWILSTIPDDKRIFVI